MKRFSPGQVFAIPLGDGTTAFGQLLARQTPIFYGAGFACRAAAGCAPGLAEIVASPILFLGNFLEEFLKSGRWTVLGRHAPPRAVPYPSYKVLCLGQYYVESWDQPPRSRLATPEEAARLPNRTNCSSLVLENAFRGHYGLAEHDRFVDVIRAEAVGATAGLV